MYSLGIDIGSTTVKMALVDESNNLIFSDYKRHKADIRNAVIDMLKNCISSIGNISVHAAVTGSGGISFSGRFKIPFVQEVIAVTCAMKEERTDTDVIIELGGEDAKIVFMTNGIEQRMNGICAGGTGAFIDQMADLLQMNVTELNECAAKHKRIYPIAARCGVFAKSDIQPLINDGVSRDDLAASIFKAVVDQTISGLACGRKISGNVALLGGPLYFLSELRNSFKEALNLDDNSLIFPKNAHLFAARGTAIKAPTISAISLEELIDNVCKECVTENENNRMQPLFDNESDYDDFVNRNKKYIVKEGDISTYEGNCYLGIDAGSTTTKAVLIGDEGQVLFSYYENNKGEPVKAAKNAMNELSGLINNNINIVYSCSTGYGEGLIKEAFSLDEGEVETIAHMYAAREFSEDVDCIIDIGGQDMKYIRLNNGIVDTIMLNEACSSGCGSFIENFAGSLGYTASEFSALAVKSKNPVDLGIRCTVFMNSNVKQAQKEGALPEDIAAGLSYAVVRNALFKVIKLTDVSQLGKNIVVQGGTFLNESVLRAFELVSGCEVIRPDIAGLMGAYGAALIAKEHYSPDYKTSFDIDIIRDISFETHSSNCSACQNNCRLTVNKFNNNRVHVSGNRCENGQGNNCSGDKVPDIMEYKLKRLFDYKPLKPEEAARGIIGIPRVLNIYEDYPFWAIFFKELGYSVLLSPQSSREIYSLGMDSIPSESECYPAKLAHGHIRWLIENGADKIFYPCVVYEEKESKSALNNYNCPMVISYPENIKNNVDEIKNVSFIQPFISFADEDILKKRMIEVFNSISSAEIKKACEKAWKELKNYRNDIRKEGIRVLEWIEEHESTGIVVAGRPYHTDPEVNHGINKMIASYGYAVLTEDSVAHLNSNNSSLRVFDQWVYHSRLYNAAKFVSERDNLELVQLNSFGCGLDAVTVPAVAEILESAGKMHTLLKIDEISNLGAARIRMRSLFSALKLRKERKLEKVVPYERIEYLKKMNDDGYTILCPGMTFPLCDFISAAAVSCGYNIKMLKNEGQTVIDNGLKYVNNDACYPAMIVIGQIIDAVTSGDYDTDKLAVMMVQTGGGCRATNYISFLRKALKDSGYSHIPVVSLSFAGIEKNEGFKLSPKLVTKALQGVIYSDLINQLTYRVRPYEKVTGETDALKIYWCENICTKLKNSSYGLKGFYSDCRQLIKDFDNLEINEDLKKPKVGIVGEVLVKFMPAANNHLARTLEDAGAEVVIPEMLEFIKYCIGNSRFRNEKLGKNSKSSVLIQETGSAIIERVQRPVKKYLAESNRFKEPHDIKITRENAYEILSEGNQCGEGWFLAGETVDLIKSGVSNVVCVQPFGCLPNHIVGKGIIKKVKTLYPQSNIVAVDYDPSASKVNQINRIKLMLETAEGSI